LDAAAKAVAKPPYPHPLPLNCLASDECTAKATKCNLWNLSKKSEPVSKDGKLTGHKVSYPGTGPIDPTKNGQLELNHLYFCLCADKTYVCPPPHEVPVNDGKSGD